MKKTFLFIFLIISSFNYAQDTDVENNPQNDYFLAESYFNEGEYEKATQLYKKLYDKSPFNTTYLKRLVACYQETGQFLAVENLLEASLQSNPYQPFLYVILGYNFDRQQEREKAEKNYQLALKSIEDQPHFSGFIGSLFQEYSLLDYAIIAFEKGMEKSENANYNFQIAQIYGEKGNYEKMFQSYVDMIDKNENYLITVQSYASRYISDDATNENNILFRKTLLRKSVSNPKAAWNILLSWLFAQQKEYSKALIQEKALFQRDETELSSIFNLGVIAFNNDDFDAAKQCFDFILSNTKMIDEKLSANLILIKIAVKTNNLEADKLFDQIFTTYGKGRQTLAFQIEYADYLTFSKNEPENAKIVLEEAIGFASSKFEEARIKLKLGDILVFTGLFNKALIYFSQIQTQLKNDELGQEARFKVAQTSYFKGDFTWAKAQLKILKSSTTQLIANDAVELYLIITDNEPVDSIPSGLTQFAKADLLAFQNKNQEAIEILSEIISKFKGQPIEDEALFNQAKLFIKQKEFDNAITNFEKVIALNPEGILIDDAYYEMAEVYANHLNNQEKASAYYQKIIFDFGSSIYLVDARKKYRKFRGDDIN